MLALEFFSWWYGHGWRDVLQQAVRRTGLIADVFSVSVLLRTLFSPWRRIITSPGAGLNAHLRALIDNSVSRVIGFLVRLTVLIAAFIVAAISTLVSVLLAILWPLLPLSAIGLLVWGLV